MGDIILLHDGLISGSLLLLVVLGLLLDTAEARELAVDLEDVPSNVAKDMTFHFAKEIKDVLKVAVSAIYSVVNKSNNSPKI